MWELWTQPELLTVQSPQGPQGPRVELVWGLVISESGSSSGHATTEYKGRGQAEEAEAGIEAEGQR